MAERSFMYCPTCLDAGVDAELIRGNPEMHLFRCLMNHAFTYDQLQALNPKKIPYVPKEAPGPSDVNASFFIPAEILSRFREKHPHQQNATIASILHLHLDDDVIIISGDQARKLKALGVRTGQEMLVVAQQNQTLTAENETLSQQINMFENMFTKAGIEAPV
jgi:hypothetical protein